MPKPIAVELVRNGGVVEHLDRLVGQPVRIGWSSLAAVTAGFHTQVAVTGALERHPTKAEFRVVLADGTFAYLADPSLVLAIVEPPKGRPFKGGAVAAIHLAGATDALFPADPAVGSA